MPTAHDQDTQIPLFHLEEYKQLRTEVASLLNRVELLFRYSLVALASVSAWLVSNSMGMTGSLPCLKLPPALIVSGWLISPAFIVCAARMASSTNDRITQIGDYLRKIEERYGNAALGWELFLEHQASIITTTTKQVWWLLFFVSLGSASIGIYTTVTSKLSCA